MPALPECFELIQTWRPEDIAVLAAGLTWEQPKIRVFGREHLTPRLVAWFGDGAYSYAGQRHEPAPLPPALAEAREAVEVVSGARFNSVLLNYYRDGRDSVAWHADDEPELGAEPTIASLSLGAARTFAVKSRTSKERWSTTLGCGDLLIMRGRSQLDYLHSVPKTSRPVGARLNLTFRHMV